MKVEVAAVLDTMWGSPGMAPRWFYINPRNLSGSRLLKLTGQRRILVTNICKEQVESPDEHGTPDLAWLEQNLSLVQARLLLVCGNRAQQTFSKLPDPDRYRSLYIPHPAARIWSKARVESYAVRIKQILEGNPYALLRQQTP